jgi:hypothetical protein
MGDRVVVLRSDDGLGFLADACAALAEAVNEVRVARAGDADLVEVYAEVVVAYSRLARRRLDDCPPAATARGNILRHLEERIRQAGIGEITIPLLDVVDRLHGELTREPTAV